MRYKVIEKSLSAHCCFVATVVDTDNLEFAGDDYADAEFETVCECLEVAHAYTVCAALNAAQTEART